VKRLLLDTHAMLWWLDQPKRLTATARAAIAEGESTVYVSAVTVWEIVIKKVLGKLQAPNDLDRVLVDCRFTPLPISVDHALEVSRLPAIHHDPFDRMLIAQARLERLEIVTRDDNIIAYGVPYIRA
jgi:PIN domain nuclease of toxin-antitoxin system